MSKTLNIISSHATARRSSLFEVPSHLKPTPKGSSHISFCIDPLEEEDFQDMLPKKPKKVYYENTYQMEPPVKFQAEKVTRIIQEVLDSSLAEKTYDPISCSMLSKTLAQDIKLKVKDLDFQRYKLISLVTIGEKKDQGIRVGSRCIWDKDRDNFSTAMFENTHIFAIGTVYAVYYE